MECFIIVLGKYKNITLGYGRKTGVGGYGPAHGTAHGARVIELNQNNPKR